MTEHPSFSTTIGWDPAGGTSYVTISQVKDITGPSISRDTIEVTHRDISNNYKVFWGGYADGGELGFDLVWDPKEDTHIDTAGTGLLADFEDQDNCTLPAWQLETDVCGGTATWTFDGRPTGFEQESPENGVLGASLTVKISGKPTLTVT